MTSLPADRFELAGRGLLTPGAWADVAVFDPAEFRDVATFEEPQREPVGLPWLVVNGALTYDRGRHTGARAGRLLSRRTRSVANGSEGNASACRTRRTRQSRTGDQVRHSCPLGMLTRGG